MKVGFVGLGKLGLPVAAAMASRGLEVYGYDIKEPDVEGAKAHEEGFTEVWERGRDRLHICSLAEVVRNAEVCFLAVQTPHEPRFEGVTPLPEERADFDYSHLVTACKDFAHECDKQGVRRTLSVISTVLPGTMQGKVIPKMGSPNVSLVYNPSFIAMGSVISDFLDPEFVLVGGDAEGAVSEVYERVGAAARPGHAIDWGAYCALLQLDVDDMWQASIYHTSIPNAELIKVAYNTFIGLKLAFANTLMEVCHKTACDVDEVTGALKLAHRRLISPAYLDGGMGDGGGCHPRDNIALSWLARELDLSHDLFEDAMVAREQQTEWLCELVAKEARERKLGVGILGLSYKPGSHLSTGSPARLAKCILHDKVGFPFNSITEHDPYVEGCPRGIPPDPKVWLVGCKHPDYVDMEFPAGTVIVDPWRYIPDQEGVEIIRVGSSDGRKGAAKDLSPSRPLLRDKQTAESSRVPAPRPARG